MNNLEDIIQREELTEIANISDGGGYEWEQMKVWYSEEERRFFWLSGSGCSCSYFGMGAYSLDSLENGSKDAALRALQRFTDEANRYSRQSISTDSYLRAKDAITAVRVGL